MLTDKDLEMLRQERHNDYLAEATRERKEAIANADAHTNNAGLPTYSELVASLRQINAALTQPATFPADVGLARKAASVALARIPA